MVLGITSGAKVVDNYTEQGIEVYELKAVGVAPRIAIANAKRELAPLIPLRDIEVLDIEFDRDLGFRERHKVFLTHNTDSAEEESIGY